MLNRSQIIALAAAALAAACGNEAPTVDAGDDFNATVGSTVELSPTGMDAEDDFIEYEWRLVSKPDGSEAELTDADRPDASFTPDVVGQYVAEVVNFDEDGRSEPDTVTITVRDAPVAVIAPIPVVMDDGVSAISPGESITLDASDSTVAEGQPIAYQWALVAKPEDDPDTEENEGSALEISDAMATMPTLTVTPEVAGAYVFELTVADGAETVADGEFADSTTVTVFARQPPVARFHLALPIPTSVGATITLNAFDSEFGAGSEPSYTWTVASAPAGSTAEINVEDSSVAPTFVPDEPGAYEVTLVVSDGVFTSEPTSASFTAIAGAL